MRFEMRFAFPDFIKYEESGIRTGLVQIVVDAAGFGTCGSHQAFQNSANARFLARLRADMRDQRESFIHECVAVSLWVNILALNQLENVAVHYEGEDTQQEDQTYLHEAFLYGDA
jgi:hypothetical protein